MTVDMTTRNLSMPGNPRYQPQKLVPYFGYDNLFGFVARVEIAVMEILGALGVIPREDFALLTPAMKEALIAIPTTAVDEVERKETKHDIRAWVKIAQQILPPQLRRWAHVPLTSYDVLDTARALQFKSAHEEVVAPLVRELVQAFIEKVRQHAEVVQIGRTHGQHALPITVGFWLATILHRIVSNAKHMDVTAHHLVGKISGAVGAHNAQVGLGIYKRHAYTPALLAGGPSNLSGGFDEMVLQRLGLSAAPISTQILPPEPLAYYLSSAVMMSAALGQFGEDCRQLMRTEIGEICEPFDDGQVGSSTMPHKRNPINFENLCGTWLKTKNMFPNVLDTLVSEHQRDLVGSSVHRDFPIIPINLTQQLNTLLRRGKGDKTFFDRLTIDVDTCNRNFDKQANVILAEPLYLALQMYGYEGDAHHVVNHQAVTMVHKGEVSNIMDAITALTAADVELRRAMKAIPAEVVRLLQDPRSYTGLAATKAAQICEMAEGYLKFAVKRIA